MEKEIMTGTNATTSDSVLTADLLAEAVKLLTEESPWAKPPVDIFKLVKKRVNEYDLQEKQLQQWLKKPASKPTFSVNTILNKACMDSLVKTHWPR